MRAFLNNLLGVARRYRRLAIWSSGLVALAVAVGLALSPVSPLDRLNLLVYDGYQTLRPRPAAESAVVVIDVDDESIRRIGQWPWSRTVIAEIVDRLAAMGAASIAFDIVFSEPDRTSPALAVAQLEKQGFQIAYPGNPDELDHDKALAGAFARAPVVAGLVMAESGAPPPRPKAGFAFGGDNPSSYLPAYGGSVRNLPILDQAAPGLGVFSFPPERDGVVRRIPLLSRFGSQLYPGLSIEALRLAVGASGYIVRSTGASGEYATGNPGMTALKVGDFEIPTGADGRLWVYYAARPPAPVISAHRVLAAEPDAAAAQEVAGRIVLIGTSAVGLRDLVSTPLAAGVPGVLVHGEIVDQIVHQRFLTRPDWADGMELVLAVGLSLLLLALLPFLSTTANALSAAAAMAVAVGAGWYAFAHYSLLLSPLLTAFCCLLTYGAASGARLLLSESEGRYIRTAFSHYLSPVMVQRLVENPESLVLGGENRELTLLFCDIRGFTSISETMEPTQLTVFLNNFLTPMTDVLMRNGATIDKYMGDAIMAFWNAPIDMPDHRRRAGESVLGMLAALEQLNAALERPVRIGVGLNSGVCCVGNLGSRQRFDYSAIGDPVNLASRVEGLTKLYGLSNLVTASTAEGLADLALVEVDLVAVVGRDEPTAVYTIIGGPEVAASPAFLAFRDEHGLFLAAYRGGQFEAAAERLRGLRQAVPAQFARVYDEYAQRLAIFASDPPPGDWDGAYHAEHK
jgi:adenylate cyclase